METHLPEPAHWSKAELAAQLRTDVRNPYVGILYRLSGLRRLEFQPPELGTPAECAAALLRQLGVEAEWVHGHAESVPTDGPLIVVANHPFGSVDALLLLSQIPRPDLRILIDHGTATFAGLEPAMLRTDLDAAEAAADHLGAGGALLVFPSEGVHRQSRDLSTAWDGRWSTVAARLQRETGADVLPVFLDGWGLDMVKLFEAVHPGLRRLPLPHRPLRPLRKLRSKQRAIRIRAGRPVRREDVAAFDHLEQVTRFLRAKVYALGTSIPVRPTLFERVRSRAAKEQPLAAAIAPEALAAELASLPDDALQFEQSGFQCFVADYQDMPLMMQEIGRLREATFRAVGEGTNEASDLDEFDLHYRHLILWDAKGQAVAGAYRMGVGPQIMELYGKRGFYTSTLFRFAKPFRAVLGQAIELGRSFVPLAYQKHRMPLFLLWKGILVQLLRHPECRYLIGPVTISNSYNPLSRLLMMNYVRQAGGADEFKGMVTPRKPYKPKVSGRQDPEALLASVGDDIRRLDRVVADIEPEGMPLPVLLKRYLAQNARILAFNHDPKFNDALDGFMVLDLDDLPPETVANLQREFIPSPPTA